MLLETLVVRFRRGFTFTELLITLGIVAAVSAAVIPAYRIYMIRSDLDIAYEQTKQMLRRAQLKSQTGEEASAWGVKSDTGTIFKGHDYASRDIAKDEVIAVPAGITVTGLTELYYSPLYGLPSAVGDIVFTAVNGDQKIITVRSDTLSGPPIPPVRFKVRFDRIQNSGNGSAENKVFVGPNATLYEEGAWINLTDNALPIIDDGMVLNVNGLSVERENGFVRIVEHGGLDSGGKEVIDATIQFDRGYIDSIANEEGEHEGEQPFDGNVNNGVGGDEYTLAADQKSVLFQTRSTNAGDTILIYWKGGNP